MTGSSAPLVICPSCPSSGGNLHVLGQPQTRANTGFVQAVQVVQVIFEISKLNYMEWGKGAAHVPVHVPAHAPCSNLLEKAWTTWTAWTNPYRCCVQRYKKTSAFCTVTWSAWTNPALIYLFLSLESHSYEQNQ